MKENELIPLRINNQEVFFIFEKKFPINEVFHKDKKGKTLFTSYENFGSEKTDGDLLFKFGDNCIEILVRNHHWEFRNFS